MCSWLRTNSPLAPLSHHHRNHVCTETIFSSPAWTLVEYLFQQFLCCKQLVINRAVYTESVS